MKIYLRQKFLKSTQPSCQSTTLVIYHSNQNTYIREGLLEDIELKVNLKKALGREAKEVPQKGNSFSDYSALLSRRNPCFRSWIFTRKQGR